MSDPRKKAGAHGTEYRYRRGCSCLKCRAAEAARHRKIRRRNPAKYVRSTRVCAVCGEPVWASKPGQKLRHARRADHEIEAVSAPWIEAS